MAKKCCDELALMAVKWFDYRILTPDQATMECLYHYALATRHFQKEAGNGSYFNFLVRVDLSNPKEWGGWKFIEKIRQHADSLGMPYNLYWDFAYVARSRIPFQRSFISVFLNKHLQKMVAELTAKHAENCLILSDHRLFRPESYTGCWIQKLYFNYVVRAAWERFGKANFQRMLGQILEDGKIPLDFLIGWKVSKGLTTATANIQQRGARYDY